ncbi:hypothetical protein D9758_014747 [Tetrapyrgos nigripes]|uniref:Uncharacterized protein n=1 Tax=Tetrapyrgos nigripes TaxID=182062 RepID=A0A8H5CGI2_9AGAR|nr:hypothetical protein D9758_014747 [Tetrapyrgos nigripes]
MFQNQSKPLDSKKGITSPGPIVNGYFSMFHRVYKLKGWAGLYKGFTYRLSSWEPRTALHVLLTPAECQSPWKLYLIPGLFFSYLLSLLWTGVIGTIATTAIAWKILDEGRKNHNKVLKWVFVGVYVAVIVVTALVTCPLQVLLIRLTLQRNHGPCVEGEYVDAVSGPRMEVEQVAKLELKEYSKDVEAIGLRNEDDLYTSLHNCFIHMKQEEGIKVFYQAYWVTLLSGVFSSGMSVIAL